jgi:hypothetical protein
MKEMLGVPNDSGDNPKPGSDRFDTIVRNIDMLGKGAG